MSVLCCPFEIVSACLLRHRICCAECLKYQSSAWSSQRILVFVFLSENVRLSRSWRQSTLIEYSNQWDGTFSLHNSEVHTEITGASANNQFLMTVRSHKIWISLWWSELAVVTSQRLLLSLIRFQLADITYGFILTMVSHPSKHSRETVLLMKFPNCFFTITGIHFIQIPMPGLLNSNRSGSSYVKCIAAQQPTHSIGTRTGDHLRIHNRNLE